MPAKWQTIRVFISSTFRDMHAERDHLVRVVFPALREKLIPYRLHLNDIDLRWGVTKEQAENEQTLDLCLQQIDQCRPFFVGILGERYGWIPARLPDLNKPECGWIQGLTGKSITELEILHGVLNNPKMHPHSIFLFRDPTFMKDVLEPVRPQVAAEVPQSAQKLANLKQRIRDTNLPIPPLENYPCRFAGLRLNWRIARLELEESDVKALEAVAGDGLVTNEEYATLDDRLREIVNREAVVYLDGLEEFGKAVYSRLWEAIKAEYDLADEATRPKEGERDGLADELDYHERFMESRLRVYVGREEVYKELRAFANGDQTVPCLVTGPPGSGKSAALAKFVTTYAGQHPEMLVIPHFVGASPGSTNLRLLLRRFCLTLQREFAFTETPQQGGQPTEAVPAEVPQTINELVPKFREFVGQVPEGRRVLLAIDALNQLDETDNAQSMYWLPREWPAHVKAILSCADDSERSAQALQAFELRPHRRVAIGPLTDDERLKIAREVPSLSAKTLSPSQVTLLLQNPATESPLFLLVALEELRGFRSYEQIDSRIRLFPREGDTVTALFMQVIERLEDEFGEELTRAVLTLLASARRGLSDLELLELIEDVGVKVEESATGLFPVLRQLRPYLQHRAALQDFFHRNLYRAVRERYMATAGSQAAAHGRLADYFAGQDNFAESLEEQRARARRLPPTPRPVNTRKVDELPFQRLEVAKLLGKGDPKSKHWDSVADLLTDWQFLEAKAEARP